MQFSTAVRDAINNAIELLIGTAPQFRIYTGSIPANPAASATGTLICQFSLPSDWMGASSSGTASKSGTWSGTGAGAAGVGATPGYWRIYDSTGTTCHWQGTISLSVSGAWAQSTVYAFGARVSNGGNVYTCVTAGTSNGSGSGPSGTGSGITDGTAVWDYVSALGDLQIDTPQIASGQAVSVSSFSITASNA